MTTIELTHLEGEVLVEILETYISDLRTEIVGTERIAMRTMMKEKEEIAKGLLARLASAEEEPEG